MNGKARARMASGETIIDRYWVKAASSPVARSPAKT